MARFKRDEVRMIREAPEEAVNTFRDDLRKAEKNLAMGNPIEGDSYRHLAEMIAQDPEVLRLIEAVCMLKEAHGSEGLDSLLDMWEETNRPPNRRLDN
jgi:hypothetical protein